MIESTDPTVELWIDRGSRVYAPGELLTGGFRPGAWRDAGLRVVELSVLWYTAGQGEEDLSVHHFERRREAVLPSSAVEAPQLFECELPESPLSYDGQIVRICWAARVRGFFPGGAERVVEAPFWLGHGGAPRDE